MLMVFTATLYDAYNSRYRNTEIESQNRFLVNMSETKRDPTMVPLTKMIVSTWYTKNHRKPKFVQIARSHYHHYAWFGPSYNNIHSITIESKIPLFESLVESTAEINSDWRIDFYHHYTPWRAGERVILSVPLPHLYLCTLTTKYSRVQLG